jgi:hypothetical protein
VYEKGRLKQNSDGLFYDLWAKKIYLGYNAIKLNQLCGLVFVREKSAKYSTHYFNK